MSPTPTNHRGASQLDIAPSADSNLSALETAILQTVTYVDMYDYPLTAAEIHRYLVGLPSGREEVERALQNGRLSRRLDGRNGYYGLAGREAIFEIRQRREAAALELWPTALRYGRLIAALPFVRMVALTGSLAVGNAASDSDIDYLIITANDRLWLCRAMTIAVVRAAARHNVSLCPNYLLTERAMVFGERNLYTARELAQMVPVAGFATYARLRQLNPWVTDFLPNAAGRPLLAPPAGPDPVSSRRVLRGAAELALRTPPAAWLERWERQRKIRKFSRHEQGQESAFSADWCKGHFQSHAQRALDQFTAHWLELEESQP